MGEKQISSQMDKILRSNYFNPSSPSSFGGIQSLSKQTRIPISQTKKWLERQDTYTLHKEAKVNFPRRKTIAFHAYEIFQCDLIDMIKYAKFNKDYKYILTVIDVFSRFAFAFPLKSKHSANIINAFKKLFSFKKPIFVHTDRGSEFLNKSVQTFFKKEKVKFFTTFSDKKASLCERFNRTLKNKLWKLFWHRRNYKYWDVLPKLIESYNASIHRSIGTTPKEAATIPQLRSEIFERLYGINNKVIKYKYQIDDVVRITKSRSVFDKSYLPRWSDEVFVVCKRNLTNPPTYVLKDLKDKIIKGCFYEQELQRVTKTDRDIWPIEKIIRTKGRGKSKQYLVRWRGFDRKFDSWIKTFFRPTIKL